MKKIGIDIVRLIPTKPWANRTLNEVWEAIIQKRLKAIIPGLRTEDDFQQGVIEVHSLMECLFFTVILALFIYVKKVIEGVVSILV
ncbi:MAG: hypothetical protein GC180_06915 [Bacteroidetes bacterium]|nr:hypothetical protein [Bacteroidota bacterium]